MNATVVRTTSNVSEGHEESYNPGICERSEEDQGDMVIMGPPASPAFSTPTGGPGFKMTMFLRRLGDRLFGTPAANREIEVIEGSDSDYSSYGPCCCY